MYTAQILTERLKSAIKKSGKSQKTILANCGTNENALNQLTDKKGISSFTLAKISDEIGCSVDYLLGRTDNPLSHTCSVTTGDISLSNNSVSGDGRVGVTIHNGVPQDGQAALLLNIFNSLDMLSQSKLIVYADSLKNKGGQTNE